MKGVCMQQLHNLCLCQVPHALLRRTKEHDLFTRFSWQTSPTSALQSALAQMGPCFGNFRRHSGKALRECACQCYTGAFAGISASFVGVKTHLAGAGQQKSGMGSLGKS